MIARLHTKKVKNGYYIHWDGCSQTPLAEVYKVRHLTVLPTFISTQLIEGEESWEVYDLRKEKVIGHCKTLKQAKELYRICL
jgi:hypothetical protein